MPDPIERLAELFEKFPGIGPRQAQRFVQYLLRSSPSLRRDLAHHIQELGSVRQCPECMRFHAGDKKLCSICGNTARDASILAVVAADSDLLALERSGEFRGKYFVLGGTLHLASEKANGLRIRQLLDSLPKRIESDLEEIVLAFPANPEGDATADTVQADILELKLPGVSITKLGRGLSTGSELEYADPETIKSALDSRR